MNVTIDKNTEGYYAIVNGIKWTPKQTKQAQRDAGCCRCGSCVCCQIKQGLSKYY